MGYSSTKTCNVPGVSELDCIIAPIFDGAALLREPLDIGKASRRESCARAAGVEATKIARPAASDNGGTTLIMTSLNLLGHRPARAWPRACSATALDPDQPLAFGVGPCLDAPAKRARQTSSSRNAVAQTAMAATKAESNARSFLSSNGDVSRQPLCVRVLAMTPFSLLTWVKHWITALWRFAVMEITQLAV
jgi:hypothetical protein